MALSPNDPVWQVACEGDRDRYFGALLAPQDERAGLMALAAFNGDLVRIAESTSEPQLGEIRLQWWREALERLAAGAAGGSPVADALGAALKERIGLILLLKGVVEARAFDVAGGVMADEQALDAYLFKTQGALFRAAASLVSAPDHPVLDAAAQAGLAYGKTRLLCLLPHDLARGRVFLPRDVLARHGIDAAGVLADPDVPGVAAVCDELREGAKLLEARARRALRDCSAAIRRAVLPFALTRAELAALEPKGGRVGGPSRVSPLGRLYRLVWAGLRGHL